MIITTERRHVVIEFMFGFFSVSQPETDPGYLYDGLSRDDGPSGDDKLPPSQKDSIDGLISAFKFMLEDEIAFALTQANPITQHILAKV